MLNNVISPSEREEDQAVEKVGAKSRRPAGLFIKSQKPKGKRDEIVLLEELVPEDHLLRRINKAMDFSFIHDMCKDLYCPDNGRPAIEPELRYGEAIGER